MSSSGSRGDGRKPPTGRQLSRAMWEQHVRSLVGEMLPARSVAAALVGPGSEVLGHDDATSQDHDFGPRLLLLVPADAVSVVDEMLAARLPQQLAGYPVRYATTRHPAIRHHVKVTTLEDWSTGLLGHDATQALTDEQWLGLPWQQLAEATSGEVFHDGRGTLHRLRQRLRWYPDHLHRYVLACQWRRIAQQEGLFGRTAAVGDEVGSTLVAAAVVHDALRLWLLMSRTWPTYDKWLGTTVEHDEGGSRVIDLALSALQATRYAEREPALGDLLSLLATRHNEIGLTEHLDTRLRAFHTRGYLVIGAERFVEALITSVTDSHLRTGPLTGAVSQWVDSTDVLRAVPLRAVPLRSAPLPAAPLPSAPLPSAVPVPPPGL